MLHELIAKFIYFCKVCHIAKMLIKSTQAQVNSAIYCQVLESFQLQCIHQSTIRESQVCGNVWCSTKYIVSLSPAANWNKLFKKQSIKEEHSGSHNQLLSYLFVWVDLWIWGFLEPTHPLQLLTQAQVERSLVNILKHGQEIF